nr:immunoglobulin heavy chain junction region [Mus musculus]MBK4197272.1 immunoglobulin heavy chain junction region [Mus musculus]MBK4197273.1 immunoglobulin heavy chain junction region [Mus musculus]MBK4197274.1 immunoglobulin heavy chain junction region [Mus musculus]MBK4197275.1 immunoglobulin heavy chain junction region [Mus musculus]
CARRGYSSYGYWYFDVW